MKTLWVIIFSILICSSLYGQTSNRLLILKDSMNNALIGATIMYFDNNGNEIITTRSDLDGRVFLRTDFKSLSAWLIGFKKIHLDSFDLKNDTNVFIFKSVIYNCPELIVEKDGKFLIDSSNFIGRFLDKEIYCEDNCKIDTIKEQDGTIIIEAEICDTIRQQVGCTIASPKSGYTQYYETIAKTILQLRKENCYDSNLLTLYFSVNRLGEMNISSLEGVKSSYGDIFVKKIKDIWIPAKMWGRSLTTDYKMKILIK